MKKAGLVFLSACLVYLAAGCASAGKAVAAQKDLIALVSVVSNRDINWQGEDPINPNVIGPLARRALRAGEGLTIVSNTEELINTAEKIFRDTMAEQGLINLADKETVLGSQAYQGAKLNKYQLSQDQNQEKVKAAGYRYIDYRDTDFPAALLAETGIQRCMFVEFNFTKVMASGFGKNGNFRAQMDMNVTIQDVEGKVIFRKIYPSITSTDTIKVSSGVYSQSELINLFNSVISGGCGEFLNDLAD